MHNDVSEREIALGLVKAYRDEGLYACSSIDPSKLSKWGCLDLLQNPIPIVSIWVVY